MSSLFILERLREINNGWILIPLPQIKEEQKKHNLVYLSEDGNRNKLFIV